MFYIENHIPPPFLGIIFFPPSVHKILGNLLLHFLFNWLKLWVILCTLRFLGTKDNAYCVPFIFSIFLYFNYLLYRNVTFFSHIGHFTSIT